MASIYRATIVLLTCIGILAFCFPCFAESTDELEVQWLGDSIVLGATGAMWLTFELLKDEIAPKKCIWCTTNSMDEAITDAIAWDKPRNAAWTSDILAMGVVPALSASALFITSGLDDRFENSGVDLMLLGEAVVLSSLANQFVKFSVEFRGYVGFT